MQALLTAFADRGFFVSSTAEGVRVTILDEPLAFATTALSVQLRVVSLEAWLVAEIISLRAERRVEGEKELLLFPSAPTTG
jgi:hypothetical protein